jgi:hypothetical protein
VLTWPVKDPNEVLDYDINWAPQLGTGELLASSVFSVVSGTVEIDSDTYDADGVTTVWLSGGAVGEACIILNRVTTSEDRTYDQSVRLRIRSK